VRPDWRELLEQLKAIGFGDSIDGEALARSVVELLAVVEQILDGNVQFWSRWSRGPLQVGRKFRGWAHLQGVARASTEWVQLIFRQVHWFLGELAKLLAIPALILSGLSAWYAYSNLRIQRVNTTPSIDITSLNIDSKRFRMDVQNTGGSNAYSVGIIAFSFDENNIKYLAFSLSARNPIPRGISRLVEGPSALKTMKSTPIILCISFLDRGDHVYSDERFYKIDGNGVIQDMRPEEANKLSMPELCGREAP